MSSNESEPKRSKASKAKRRRKGEKAPSATKLSAASLERIEEALAMGATWRLAAAAGGVSEDTLLRWRHNDTALAERLYDAKNRGAIECLRTIRDAGLKDWRAARELLTFAFPEEYGKNRHELSGPDGASIPVRVDGEQKVNVTVDLADAVGKDPEAVDAFLAYLGRRIGDRARPSESRLDAEVGDSKRS
jgi:hypothetical protein